MELESYLEFVECDTVEEFMRRLALYPEPRERRIIMSRIGLLPFHSFKELGEDEGVSGTRARQLFGAGLSRMRDQEKRRERLRNMP